MVDASYHNNMNVTDVYNSKWLKMLGWKPNITITVDISKNLQFINYADNYFHNINLKDSSTVRVNVTAKNLQELNLSNTNFPIRYIYEADTPNLEVLDITGSTCQTIYVHLFEKATKLRKIVAENIKLNFDELESIFYSLKNLEELDVYKSNLRNIPPTLLKYQTVLFRLNLDENFFPSFPATLKYVQNLKELYIRFNKITYITESDFVTFKRLGKAKIFIQGNPINCDCLHVQSLKWIKEIQHLFMDLNETLCSEKSSTVLEIIQEKTFEEFVKNCQTDTWLALSILMLLILIVTITVVFLAKKYRVHIDYVILKLRSRWKGVYSVESGDFQFDAFISYAEDDYRIVSTTLYQTLTQRGFQISFPDKDFIPGISKADELLRCVDKSRKVVFIITENFLANGWNSYAVQMTVTHSFHNNRRQSIIVIIKDNITIQRMPKDLRYIWWSIVSIRWPETSDLMEQFWDELDRALKSV
ncbi:toll-like receptor 4 [Saccostrea cucullata]|uniref:toll-like receptor 4 n=1 Tax=Saccostrea cuccullata TaxID=36930 RepID=UPI002ED2F38E